MWLIDSTGAYNVRAHCIGGGRLPPDIIKAATVGLDLDEKQQQEQRKITMISDWVNQRLLDEYFPSITSSSSVSRASSKTSFGEITVEEGLKRLVLILANKQDLESSDENNQRLMRPPTIPILRPNTRLELAIIDSRRRLFVRRTLQQLIQSDQAINEMLN